jgi:quercetin dioxygenase-like cupin family protein
MLTSHSRSQDSHPVIEHEWEVIDNFGPTVEFLIEPGDSVERTCLIRGTIPPGVSVPLHNHADWGNFYIISGAIRALVETTKGLEWKNGTTGDFIRIPSGAKHAFQNISLEPAILLILTTARLGQFLQEIGKRRGPGEPSHEPNADDLQHFIATAARYQYWLADAEENAAVGISIPPMRPAHR